MVRPDLAQAPARDDRSELAGPELARSEMALFRPELIRPELVEPEMAPFQLELARPEIANLKCLDLRWQAWVRGEPLSYQGCQLDQFCRASNSKWNITSITISIWSIGFEIRAIRNFKESLVFLALYKLTSAALTFDWMGWMLIVIPIFHLEFDAV